MLEAGSALADSKKIVARSVGLRVRFVAAVEASEAARKRSVLLCARAMNLSEAGRHRRWSRETNDPASISPAGQSAYCDGTVVIHKDLTVTCTEVNCFSARDDRRNVVSRHSWFTACADTLGVLCPRCNSGDEWPVRR